MPHEGGAHMSEDTQGLLASLIGWLTILAVAAIIGYYLHGYYVVISAALSILP